MNICENCKHAFSVTKNVNEFQHNAMSKNFIVCADMSIKHGAAIMVRRDSGIDCKDFLHVSMQK